MADEENPPQEEPPAVEEQPAEPAPESTEPVPEEPPPPAEVPVEEASPAEAPPAEAPPAEAPPAEAPPAEAPPAEAPSAEAPPVEAPPVEAPPTEEPSTAEPKIEEAAAEAVPVTAEEAPPPEATQPEQESTPAAEVAAPTDATQPEQEPSPTGEGEPVSAPTQDEESKPADTEPTTEEQQQSEEAEGKRESVKPEGEEKTEIRASVTSDKARPSQVRVSISPGEAMYVEEEEAEEPSGESLSKKPRGSLKATASKPETRKRLGSKAQKVVGSIISIRRMSTAGDYYDKSKAARYMNTYKLDSDNPFNSEKVQKILESVMTEAMENLTYDADKCPKQAKWASSTIRTKVKELQFERYKLVCLVTIGEKTSQDVLVTCRFLWDIERDSYATFCIENTYVYGIAQCFGIYYE